jgi:hypothetical protein
MNIEKDKNGVIWITHPEPYQSGNRVASIERCDKSDVWDISISKGTFSFWFNLVISPENNEEKVIQITKDIMMFTQCGIDFQ